MYKIQHFHIQEVLAPSESIETAWLMLWCVFAAALEKKALSRRLASIHNDAVANED